MSILSNSNNNNNNSRKYGMKNQLNASRRLTASLLKKLLLQFNYQYYCHCSKLIKVNLKLSVKGQTNSLLYLLILNFYSSFRSTFLFQQKNALSRYDRLGFGVMTSHFFEGHFSYAETSASSPPGLSVVLCCSFCSFT